MAIVRPSKKFLRPWANEMTAGKHKGKSIAHVVLSEPLYIAWLRSQPPNERYASQRHDVEATLTAFDAIPFLTRCQRRRNHTQCANPANYATTHEGGHDLTFWCDNCTPNRHRAVGTALNAVRTYTDALHQKGYCTVYGGATQLMTHFIRAKAGDEEPTDEQSVAFFDTEVLGFIPQ